MRATLALNGLISLFQKIELVSLDYLTQIGQNLDSLSAETVILFK